MKRYLIIILFLNILYSDIQRLNSSNRIRYDFMNYDINTLEVNNFRDEDELLDFIESKINNTSLETDFKIEIAKKLCKRNAYKPKSKLSSLEMEALYVSFHKCKNQKFCPSGKKIWESLTTELITKLIKP